MSKQRPIPLVNRKVVRKPTERAVQTKDSSFSFDFDDNEAPSTPQLTGTAMINSLLDSTMGDVSIGNAQIKLRTQTAPLAIIEPPQIVHKLAKPEVVSFYHPDSLQVPTVLYPTHIAPRTTPGTHVVYASSRPPTAAKKPTTKPLAKSLANKVKAQQAGKNQNTISQIDTKNDNFIPLPNLSIDPTINHIPKWVVGIDPLNANDFEVPLDNLPDLMIDQGDYLLSLPNPTTEHRNIFVSIASPLRCLSGSGVMLESAYGLRKFRKYEDRYLISNKTGKPINVVEKVGLGQGDGQNEQGDGQNEKNENKNDQIELQFKEEQTMLTCPDWSQRYSLHGLDGCGCGSGGNKGADLNTVLTESTTFAVVIPPKSIIDLCYLVTTAHNHSFPPNAPLSSYILTQDFSQFNSEEFVNFFEKKSTKNPLVQMPLNCPTWSKCVCKRDMPLDIAQNYISNHIATNNVVPNRSAAAAGPINDPKITSRPNFIPILSFPLPNHGPYLISQSFGGLLTHHAPQTKYAVDLLCANGTPIYACFDAIVVDIENKSCSMGNHVTNLFDWNSICLKGYCDEVVAPANSQSLQKTTPTPQPIDQSLLDLHKFTCNDVEALRNVIYIDFVHVSTILVKTGQFVKKGQLIGYTGSTGFAPSPHLHIQVSLSHDPMAPTIPFGFKIDPNGQNLPNIASSVIPEAGYAYTTNGLINSDQYKAIFTKALHIHAALNQLPAPPSAQISTPLPKVAPKAAPKPRVGTAGTGTVTVDQFAPIQTGCSVIDPCSVAMVPLSKGRGPLEFPFDMALKIAAMIGE
jgi:murein DD-endopeptidase MepM/ murein hydrolase activator NlpD